MKSLRLLFILSWLGIFAGCSQQVSDPLEKPATFENAPGIIYLWSIGSLFDIAPPAGFRSFVIGKEIFSENKVTRKPYGIAVGNGKIYANDGRWLAGFWVLDLEKKDFFLVKDKALLGSTGIAVDNREYKYLTVPEIQGGKGKMHAGTGGGKGLILVFDETNKIVKRKTLDAKPISVAVSGDVLYVTDLIKHRVLILDKFTLEILGEFGEKGKGDEQFLFPRGVAVVGDRVFVGDTFNGRIKVFSLKGEFISQYGWYSPDPGGFIGLSGVAADKRGIVYAVDSRFLMRPKFEEVQIFDSSLFYKKGETVPPLDAPNEEKRSAIWGSFQKPYAMGGEGQIPEGERELYAPTNLAIDYKNAAYFEKYVPEGLKIEYLIWMTSQFARRGKNISVFAFMLKK